MINKLLIIVFLLGILFIAGCGNDCTQVENAAVEVLAQYNTMKRDKNNLQAEYDKLKEECAAQAKCNTTVFNKTVTMKDCIDICNPDNVTNCVTYITKIENLERSLESCWDDDHEDYRDLYHNCRDSREEEQNESAEKIDELEADLVDCFEDLEECEEDC